MIRIYCLLLLAFAFSTAYPQALTVMSFNIRLDTEADGVNAWPKRKHKVSALISRHRPDVLGVQEALHHQLQELLRDLPGYAYVGVGRDDGKQKGEYSAILYRTDRLKVLEQNTFWLSETPEVPGSKNWDAAITRVATWAKFQDLKNGAPFAVINTHFDHIGKEARAQSASIIASTIERFGTDLPVVLTGDLNCTRGDKPYQVLMQNEKIELVDPAPEEAPGTFCSFEVGSITCNPIDYVLVTPHWKIDRYRVIDENDGRYYPSDHLPVMAVVEIR